MGINTSFAALLAKARVGGADFTNTVTIGRQSLAVPEKDLSKLSGALGIDKASINLNTSKFADDFIRQYLGAASVLSMDYSDYQHADILHDFNSPIPTQMEKQYDSLIDGGTLEHIFDIKQALSNYMKLVKTGGNVFILTTANNMCGHGFYQFSPEFFYRIFSEENGFTVKRMTCIESPLLSIEASSFFDMYDVMDPAKIGRRVQLVNDKPVSIFVHAQRMEDKPVFKKPPLQSDYQMIKWDKNKEKPETSKIASATRPTGNNFKYLTPWRELRKRLRQKKKNSFKNPGFFTKIRGLID